MLDLNDQEFNRFGNVEILRNLINHIKENRIIPFIGAGMSIGIYDSWGLALEKMMEGQFIGRPSEAEAIKQQIKEGKYEQAAEMIYDKLKKLAFYNRLVAVFKEDHIDDVKLKTMSVKYLPEIFKNSLVVTTNFDKLLEKVFLLYQHSFTEKVALRHLTDWQAKHSARGGLHYLIKIHGCVSAPDEVVMTEKAYNDFYNKSFLHIERLSKILAGNYLLFIGCGLKEDRTVKLLQEVEHGDHYAILPMDGEPGENSFEKRRDFMTEKLNMNCIWYPKGKYNYVGDILEYIHAEITSQIREAESNMPEVSSVERNPSFTQTKKPAKRSVTVAKPFVKNEIITMGYWEGKPLEWRVLDVQPDRALLIAENCLLKAPYNREQIDIKWEQCSLRKEILPQLLKQIFNASECAKILTVQNNNLDSIYGIAGGKVTDDKLFLLSADEAKRYFPYNTERIALLNGKAVWWWLRSPGDLGGYAAFVTTGGSVDDRGRNVSWSECAVRPAFWRNLVS